MASIACSCSPQQRLSSCETAWVVANKQERTAFLEWRDLDSSIRVTVGVKQDKSSWRLIAADNAVLDRTKGKRRSRRVPTPVEKEYKIFQLSRKGLNFGIYAVLGFYAA
jgi:hypothetical protein